MYENIQAESWVHYDEKTQTFDESRVNELRVGAGKAFDSRKDAINYAVKLEDADDMGGTEYGIHDLLFKDGAPVKIIP